MAISEETAALVAAQLTQAWAIRSGIKKPDPKKPADGQVEAQVITIFNRFLDAVKKKA